MIKNKLYKESCIDFLKKEEVFFDHIITDIPYDVVNRDSNGIRNFDKESADILLFDLELFLKLCANKVKDKIFIFCSSEQVSNIVNFLKNENFESTLAIWQKNNPSPVNGQYIWLSGVECCVIAQKEKLNTELKNLIWRFPSGKSKNHPTEKPLNLMEFIVLNYTKENEIIYDPCSGSGSTLEACIKNNRNYIGTEIEEKYYSYAMSRLNKYNKY